MTSNGGSRDEERELSAILAREAQQAEIALTPARAFEVLERWQREAQGEFIDLYAHADPHQRTAMMREWADRFMAMDMVLTLLKGMREWPAK